MTDRPAQRHSRRDVLRLAAGGGAAALLAACGLDGGDAPVADPGDEAAALPTGLTTATPKGGTAAAAPTAEAVATPRPVPEAGREQVALMAGSEWETPFVATHSGVAGPTLLVLGGVHGNEPGGWARRRRRRRVDAAARQPASRAARERRGDRVARTDHRGAR